MPVSKFRRLWCSIGLIRSVEPSHFVHMHGRLQGLWSSSGLASVLIGRLIVYLLA